MLLGGMGTAFLTSLVGMSLSIIYTVFDKFWRNRLSKHIYVLTNKLDSIYYIDDRTLDNLNEEALAAMAENGTVWVPTLSTIGNLQGKGRFSEKAVAQILESALENVQIFAGMGGLLAPGTDAGAWAVPHGSLTEYELFSGIGIGPERLEPGIRVLRDKF